MPPAANRGGEHRNGPGKIDTTKKKGKRERETYRIEAVAAPSWRPSPFRHLFVQTHYRINSSHHRPPIANQFQAVGRPNRTRSRSLMRNTVPMLNQLRLGVSNGPDRTFTHTHTLTHSHTRNNNHPHPYIHHLYILFFFNIEF